MASGFLLVFFFCITVTNGLFYPRNWHIKHQNAVPVKVPVKAQMQATECPHGWTKHENRCFIVQTSQKTMADAELSCIALGGNLASVHSSSEQWFIRHLIFKTYHSYENAWIGLFDAVQEGSWMWTDGSKPGFTHWSRDEPNNFSSGKHCTETNWKGQYWNNISCQALKPFVCVMKL